MPDMERYRSNRARLILFSKGIAMGIADIIPGVSGGTVALISGIYDHLILALNSVRLGHILSLLNLALFFGSQQRRSKALRELSEIQWSFLLSLISGIFLAVIVMSRIIPFFIDNYPFHTFSYFFGLILFSLSIPYSRMDKRPTEFVLFIIFAAVTFFITGNQELFQGSLNPGYVFFCGAVAICAMILPGISGAFILVILGEYKLILDALHERNIAVISIFLAGIIVGIFSFVRILKYALLRWHSPVMAALTGIMFGSLRKLWPLQYMEAGGELQKYILWGTGISLAGAATVYLLERLSVTLHDPEPPIES